MTGIKGWYPINMPSDSEVHGATTPFGTGKAVGGLELSLQFSEAQDRNHVLHVSRGVGWSPRSVLECDETDWLGKEEMPEDTNLEIGLKISKAWIPTSQLHSFSSGTQRADRGVMAYARYKLYNKGWGSFHNIWFKLGEMFLMWKTLYYTCTCICLYCFDIHVSFCTGYLLGDLKSCFCLAIVSICYSIKSSFLLC